MNVFRCRLKLLHSAWPVQGNAGCLRPADSDDYRDRLTNRDMSMNTELWELASYIVTVIGLPLAIFVFYFEQRKERENEDEEVYQMLSDTYIDFMKVVLSNPDLKLRTKDKLTAPTEEQLERLTVLYEMLISLFERAYLIAYEDDMPAKKARRWKSWEDFMREWCRRQDFRESLPKLLEGEDEAFAAYIRQLAHIESTEPAPPANAGRRQIRSTA